MFVLGLHVQHIRVNETQVAGCEFTDGDRPVTVVDHVKLHPETTTRNTVTRLDELDRDRGGWLIKRRNVDLAGLQRRGDRPPFLSIDVPAHNQTQGEGQKDASHASVHGRDHLVGFGSQLSRTLEARHHDGTLGQPIDKPGQADGEPEGGPRHDIPQAIAFQIDGLAQQSLSGIHEGGFITRDFDPDAGTNHRASTFDIDYGVNVISTHLARLHGDLEIVDLTLAK